MWNSILLLGHGMRIAIGLWVGFTIAAEVKAWKHPNEHAVYPVFASGASRWLNDEPLYTQGFYYSPALAAAMCPLAMLPDRVGGVLWGTFNLAIVFAALAVFCREVVQKLRPEIRAGPFLALCLAATAHGCWSGQANALALALVLFAAVAALRGQWWTAALLLAGGTHVKIWVAVVPALLALRWFRPLVPRFAAAIVLIGLLPLLSKSPAQVLASYHQWFACLLERMATGERWPGYRDAWTIWENLAPPVNRQAFSAMSLAAALLTAIWCYGRSTGVGWDKQTAVSVGPRSRLERFAQAHPIRARPCPTLQLRAVGCRRMGLLATAFRSRRRAADLRDYRPGGLLGGLRKLSLQAAPCLSDCRLAAYRYTGHGRDGEPDSDGPADRADHDAAGRGADGRVAGLSHGTHT